MRDDLCTQRIAARQIGAVERTGECLHARLARIAPVFRLRPGRTTSSPEKPVPRSSSLSLCISVLPHHDSGRPTKAFLSGSEPRGGFRTKAADGVPPGREEGKELVKSRGAAQAGGQEKNTIVEKKRRRRQSRSTCASVLSSERGESRPPLDRG